MSDVTHYLVPAVLTDAQDHAFETAVNAAGNTEDGFRAIGTPVEASGLATAALHAENERLREALAREEKAQCAIIQERDDAEEALSRMYQSVMGEPPEWSSGFGHAAAIADTEEYVEALRRRSLAKPDGLKADMYWDAEDTENGGNDADAVMESYGPFEVVQMETGFRGPNIWGFHDGTRSFVFATEAECAAAIDAAMDREGRGDE